MLFLAACAFTSCGDSGSYQFPVVGTVKTNQYKIVLHTAPDGPRYSLWGRLDSPDDQLLASEMTGQEFETRFPLIHEAVRNLYAGSKLPENFSETLTGETAIEVKEKPLKSEPENQSIELPLMPDLRKRD